MAESTDKPGTGRHAKRISSILVTQPKPTNDVSPYFAIAEKYGIKVDFREFIQVEPVSYKDFRKEKINIAEHTAIIFTSRNAVDHFFRICQEAKLEMPAEMKYFCISEQTANYLQKYIVLRKRKLFVGQRTAADLFDVIKKHKGEKFLYPCSDIRKDDIPEFMRANNFKFTEAVIYRTVASDLSDLSDVKYDCIAFFSPSGISSLFVNFPDFEQDGTRIAAFGPTTAKAVLDAGLELDIEAPQPNAPSMTGAIEAYIRLHHGADAGKEKNKSGKQNA
ncbi:uroporphyrinogen-III synthase [Hymenobacter sp. GOD-10R]|jgi:uroporphyrinogen-III synthase|uniref:uroporphyrinogen-III synthase n=1 Tax=Hymenobacter sp. GOD-10R TaxID=3093922 RepID=UPI002D799236|nr:uroporphyrinogen-III synthase [Hymenobacter sp. GOD-10R]WRQ27927.1 uroporphyrinogen-III synthase [Hymenobacter sp. GOD-10R]